MNLLFQLNASRVFTLIRNKIKYGSIIYRTKTTVSIGDIEKEIFEVKHPEYVPVNYCKYFGKFCYII